MRKKNDDESKPFKVVELTPQDPCGHFGDFDSLDMPHQTNTKRIVNSFDSLFAARELILSMPGKPVYIQYPQNMQNAFF